MDVIEIFKVFFLCFGGGFMLIGLPPLIIGIIQWYKFSHMKKYCTQKICGRIIQAAVPMVGTPTAS